MVEINHPVSSTAFRGVHREIRAPDQVVDRVPLPGISAMPTETVTDTLSPAGGMGNTGCRRCADGTARRESVASCVVVSGRRTTNSSPPNRKAESICRNACPDLVRESPPKQVATRVTVGVVELLEVVDIRHQDGERDFAPSDPVQLLLDDRVKLAPVEEPGQAVGIRQLFAGPPRTP